MTAMRTRDEFEAAVDTLYAAAFMHDMDIALLESEMITVGQAYSSVYAEELVKAETEVADKDLRIAELEHQVRAANAEKMTAVERLGWDVPVIRELREECKRLGVWGDSAVMSFQNLVRAIGERRAFAVWDVYQTARVHDFAKGPWVAP